MKLILAFILTLTGVLCFAQTGTMIDARDGKEYKTIKIGQLTWMAENLAYKVLNENSDCYKDSLNNCIKYGRLYRWEVAKEACPSGWRLPNKEEIESLLRSVGAGDSKLAFNALKRGGNSGFDALFGGYYFYWYPPRFSSPTGYSSVDRTAAFWTSTEDYYYVLIRYSKRNLTKSMAYSLILGPKKKRAVISYSNKKSAMSVRCVKE